MLTEVSLVFTRARHRSKFWAGWIHSNPYVVRPTLLLLLLLCHLLLGLPSSPFLSVCPTKTLHLSLHTWYIPYPSHPPEFDHPKKYLVKTTRYGAPHYAIFSTLLSPHPCLSPNILFISLLLNVFSVCSCLNITDHVSHPHRSSVTKCKVKKKSQ